MTNYQIKTSDGNIHRVSASTYVIDSSGLRFVGDAGTTQAIFTSFDWMRIAPVVTEPVAESATTEAPADESSSQTPELTGE